MLIFERSCAPLIFKLSMSSSSEEQNTTLQVSFLCTILYISHGCRSFSHSEPTVSAPLCKMFQPKRETNPSTLSMGKRNVQQPIDRTQGKERAGGRERKLV